MNWIEQLDMMEDSIKLVSEEMEAKGITEQPLLEMESIADAMCQSEAIVGEWWESQEVPNV